MLTIVETPLFSKLVFDYLTDDEFAEFQFFLSENPEAGDVVPGSGGVRKIRWARRGMGKSGGARVIYFNRLSSSEIRVDCARPSAMVGVACPALAA